MLINVTKNLQMFYSFNKTIQKLVFMKTLQVLKILQILLNLIVVLLATTKTLQIPF